MTHQEWCIVQLELRSDSRKHYRGANYTDRGIDIPDRIKEYLNALENGYIKLPKESISIKDISIMSKETGYEFAHITIGEEVYIIKGNENSTSIPSEIFDKMKEQKGTLDFHSHPFDGDNVPSPSDLEVMKELEKSTGQKESKIVTTDGKVTIFNKNGVLSIETVKNDISEEYRKLLEELFGGG